LRDGDPWLPTQFSLRAADVADEYFLVAGTPPGGFVWQVSILALLDIAHQLAQGEHAPGSPSNVVGFTDGRRSRRECGFISVHQIIDEQDIADLLSVTVDGDIAPEERLPHASWQHLARLCLEYRLPCTDLTPALVARSEALLAEGRFTWWRDDTHWNGAGIDAAAERVAEVLRELGARR